MRSEWYCPICTDDRAYPKRQRLYAHLTRYHNLTSFEASNLADRCAPVDYIRYTISEIEELSKV